MRTVLFFRSYKKFQGGHLKVWHYFNHVLAAPSFTPRVWFSEKEAIDDQNPWRDAQEFVVDRGHPIRPDVYFVAGANWRLLNRYPCFDPRVPVINLIQHVRHAEPERRLSTFLARKAIRICVSQEVADAVFATGSTTGPVVVIPNGTDVADLPGPDSGPPQVDVLVAALKEPELGAVVADRLQRNGRRVRLLIDRVPRPEFLAQLRGARATVFLPHETEGFYLPALEGMALGTLVVCPDCVGNRSFCLPGHNAFRPAFTIDAIVREAEAALALPPDRVRQLRENARRTAEAHSLDRERQAFLDVLDAVDELWEGTHAIAQSDRPAYQGAGARSARP